MRSENKLALSRLKGEPLAILPERFAAISETLAMIDPTEAKYIPPRALKENGVAVIQVVGPIIKGLPEWVKARYQVADPDEIAAQVDDAEADGSIETIALLIDSPGGTTAGTSDVADMIAASGKNTIAVVDDLAASAAYWIASQADMITANRTALIGCIGCYIEIFDDVRFWENNGIAIRTYNSHRLKGSGDEYSAAMTAEQGKNIKSIVAEIAAVFSAAVAAGRKIDLETVTELSTGEAWIASRALELNLIDEVVPAMTVIRKLFIGA